MFKYSSVGRRHRVGVPRYRPLSSLLPSVTADRGFVAVVRRRYVRDCSGDDRLHARPEIPPGDERKRDGQKAGARNRAAADEELDAEQPDGCRERDGAEQRERVEQLHL